MGRVRSFIGRLRSDLKDKDLVERVDLFCQVHGVFIGWAMLALTVIGIILTVALSSRGDEPSALDEHRRKFEQDVQSTVVEFNNESGLLDWGCPPVPVDIVRDTFCQNAFTVVNIIGESRVDGMDLVAEFYLSNSPGGESALQLRGTSSIYAAGEVLPDAEEFSLISRVFDGVVHKKLRFFVNQLEVSVVIKAFADSLRVRPGATYPSDYPELKNVSFWRADGTRGVKSYHPGETLLRNEDFAILRAKFAEIEFQKSRLFQGPRASFRLEAEESPHEGDRFIEFAVEFRIKDAMKDVYDELGALEKIKIKWDELN